MSTSTSSTITLSKKPRYIHSIHKLENDPQSITSAARTVGIAFDQDPLVTWLRPGALTWGHFSPETMKWQRRRLARARHEGLVVRVSTETVVDDDQKQILKIGNSSEDDKFGGVAILHPPKGTKKARSVQSIWTSLLLNLKDWLDPAGDEGSNMERVGQMFDTHNRNYEKQMSQLLGKPLWYLEVCCARPSVQGRGVGRKLMQWVIEQTKGSACLLECTDQKNIAFYRQFGFEVAEEVELVDGNDVLHTWLMVKS